MKIASLAGMLVVLQVAVIPAQGADDESVERLATSRDSWLDWKNDNAVQLKSFGEHFRSDFTRKGDDPFFVPTSSETIAGLRVLRVFPESVGMGVGFSVFVDADFDKTRKRLEGKLGKSLEKCEVSDGMRTCELEIGEKRTLTLMAGDSAKDTTTLVGCYYYYEK